MIHPADPGGRSTLTIGNQGVGFQAVIRGSAILRVVRIKRPQIYVTYIFCAIE